MDSNNEGPPRLFHDSSAQDAISTGWLKQCTKQSTISHELFGILLVCSCQTLPFLLVCVPTGSTQAFCLAGFVRSCLLGICPKPTHMPHADARSPSSHMVWRFIMVGWMVIQKTQLTSSRGTAGALLVSLPDSVL